ncbi:MAG: NADH-quinone oxidoreductase subunit N [Planctomycetes bacterium]|nr:NADH-quinone oxidoreductase subunit N [Planctomycetota bacterium]
MGSSEAALKYVIYGALASGIMLFGISWLYGLSGQLSFYGMAETFSSLSGGEALALKAISVFALLMVFVGFAYKVAAVPFHMWCPDVYEGAPTPITAILSVGPKAAGFAVMIRFFAVVFGESAIPWMPLMGLISVLTMTLGNLVAIVQDNVKRLLAYSSIAHAGYLLMAVAVFSSDAISAVMFYLGVYMLMNLGAFLVVIAVRESTGREDIGAYKGLSQTHPLLALTMAVFLFSLVGLPPLGGFIGKFYIFAALLHKGGVWYYSLALIGVLNSAISLYYYARVLKAMFFVEPEAGAEMGRAVAWNHKALAVLLSVPVLVLGVYWKPLQEFTTNASLLIK